MSILTRENPLWVERYRPQTIADTILPTHLKTVFQQFVDQKNIPNLILSGSAGVGKTTVAKAMCEELGCDYIVINGSMNGGIDTCLLYTSPSPRDRQKSRMPSSA